MADCTVKVAVRVRPLNADEEHHDPTNCVNVRLATSQVFAYTFFPLLYCLILVWYLFDFFLSKILAGPDSAFTFDHVFGVETTQSIIYEECVANLVTGKL